MLQDKVLPELLLIGFTLFNGNTCKIQLPFVDILEISLLFFRNL